MMVALGLELSIDTEMAAIYAAGREGSGKYVVQEMFYGAALLAAGEVIRLYSALDNCGVCCDPMPNAPILDELRNAGVWLHLLEAVDVSAAAGQFKALVRGRNIAINGGEALRASMQFAVRRPLAAAFAFERRRVEADMSPLNAASFALWGFRKNEGGDGDVGIWLIDAPFGTGRAAGMRWQSPGFPNLPPRLNS